MRRWMLVAGMLTMLVAAPAAAQDGSDGEGGDLPAADEATAGQKTGGDDQEGGGEEQEAAAKQKDGQKNGEEAASGGMDEETAAETQEASEPIEPTDTATDVEADDDHPSISNTLVLAPHVGVTVPQPFSDLGSWATFGAEVGIMPAIDGRPLELAVIARYSQPGSTGKGTNRNLGTGGDGNYDWELTQQILTLDLVGLWRFRNVSTKLHPYALAGPRLNLMKTTLNATGNGGEQFGEVSETNTEVGLVVGGGVDYRLGPGTLFGELRFGWSDLEQDLTGNTNAGQLVFDVGYRFYPL